MQIHVAHRYTRVTLLGGGFVGILGGLLVAKFWPALFPAWWLVSLLPLLVVFRRGSLLGLVLLLLAGGLVGLQRGSQLQMRLGQYAQFYQQKVQVTGQVRDDPVYDDKGRTDFRVGKVQVNGRDLPGQMRIRAFGAGDVARGDQISASGKLYPGFGNYQATIPYAEVAVVGESNSPIEALRRQFFAGVYTALPDPGASLGLGFLVGLRSALPQDLEDQLRVVALTHIVVASGYNLTILIRLTRRALARFSKFQAVAGSSLLMCGMVAVTGLGPSMVRAGLVTSLALATWYVGRRVHPVLLILLTAGLTAWWNPLYLWGDLGWWLSFLAFGGVMLLAPLLQKRFISKERPPLLAQIAIETMAAQLMTAPLIMMVFGQFSVLGLLANLLVVPLIPLAMLLTFVAGLAGIWQPELAGWVALPAKWLLQYIVGIVQWLAGIPWASQQILLGAWGLAVLYTCIVAMAAVWYRQTKFRYGQVPSVVE